MGSVDEGAALAGCGGEDVYIYVVGGRNRGKTVAVVERLSVSGLEWERCPSLAVSRGSHGVASLDGRVYAIAGGGINGNLTSCEVFSPEVNTWEKTCPLNTARHALASASGDGRIYTTGGWVNGSFCSGETECLRTGADRWLKCGAMKVPRRLHGLAVLDKKLYAFGGVGDSEWHPIKEAERYDPTTDEWELLPSLPESNYASCCSAGGFVYIFLWGKHVWRYSPASKSYGKMCPLPLKEWFGFAVTCWGDMIYAVGGATQGAWTGAAFAYDTTANTWKELPKMKIVRRRCGAAAISHPKPKALAGAAGAAGAAAAAGGGQPAEAEAQQPGEQAPEASAVDGGSEAAADTQGVADATAFPMVGEEGQCFCIGAMGSVVGALVSSWEQLVGTLSGGSSSSS